MLGCAAYATPPELQRWAEAMRQETAHVPDDRAALRWAMGCLRAATVERLRRVYLLDVPGVAIAGSLVGAFRAFDVMLPTALTLAYRLRSIGIAERMGRVTPGDNYQRFIPLMDVLPAWLLALPVVAGGCYVMAIVLLLRRQRTAWLALLLGVGIERITTIAGRPIAASVGVVIAPPSMLADVLLPIVLPLLLAVAAWSGSRSNRVRAT